MLLLDQEEKRSVLHITCESCHISSLVYVSLSPVGAVSVGALTDLEQSEAKQLFKAEPLSRDDVLAVHQKLTEENGMVETLIESL